ncbi:MAG: hypothetical protein LBL81_03665 [Tannerella sp.]|jgi:pilus assembly protein Flp/PilA|nr:hypothetical protein [Tannerella sp.]
MKKFIYSFLMLCCVSMGTMFAQDANQTAADKLRAEGDAAYKAKNYPTALAKYEAYLKADNYKDAQRIFVAAQCAYEAKDYESLAKYSDMAIQKGQNAQNAYVFKAIALSNLNKTDEFKSTIDAGLKAYPGNKNLEATAYNYFVKAGQAAQKQGNITQADADYTEVTTLSNPEYKGNALYALGAMYYTKGSKAITAAYPLAQSAPEKYKAAKEKAAGDLNKAKGYLEQAKTTTPSSPRNASIQKILDSITKLLK